MLERVLLGQPQNSVAIDLALSPSTVAQVCKRVLSSMTLECLPSHTPVVFVLATHAARGFPLPEARLYTSSANPGHLTVRVSRPDYVLSDALTPREQAIVRRLVEGWSTSSLAAERRTSGRTIANQLASVFRKMNVSGRRELLARVVRDHSAMWSMESQSAGQPAA
jgi:DNA-binding CsgD family transcriptional regulator